MATALDTVKSYLPQSEGLLPTFLFFVGAVALLNAVQAYLTLTYTSQVYFLANKAPSTKGKPPQPQCTPLQSRTFGTYTVLAGLIRLYAAYWIHEPAAYQLAMWTNAVAAAHFFGEWFVFKTTAWNKGLAGPVVTSVGSLVWMTTQYSWYVKA